MSFAVTATGVGLRYGKTVALDGVTFRLEAGRIYGLLGRNGSGKSSLLNLLAGFRKPTSGTIHIDGQPVFDNPAVTRGICLIRESGDFGDQGDKCQEVLQFVSELRPSFNRDYATALAQRFELPLDRPVKALSRGKKSALGIIIGLASRAPLTMFDESYLGLDAPSRYLFYDELLAEFSRSERTFILSTHLIEEVSRLFEDVVIIRDGKLLLHENAESLRTRGVTITGPASAVQTLIGNRPILDDRALGPTRAVTVLGELDAATLARARTSGVETGPVPLQDLFVHLTEPGRSLQ